MPSNDHQAEGSPSVWWRTRWLDALCASEIKPNLLFVATVYAEHAGQQRTSWVTLDRLVHRTHLARSTAQKARRDLVAAGWLTETTKAKRHLTSTYSLTLPEGVRVPSPGTLDEPRVPSVSTQGADTRHLRVPSPGTNQSLDQSLHQSLSSNQRVLMQLLDCAADDERVNAGVRLIEARQPAKPASWLRAVHANGDLDDLIADAMKPDARRIPGRDYWDKGGTFQSEPSRTTGTVEQVECTTPDCGQLIRIDRLHLPCPVCRSINKPFLKDVNAS